MVHDSSPSPEIVRRRATVGRGSTSRAPSSVRRKESVTDENSSILATNESRRTTVVATTTANARETHAIVVISGNFRRRVTASRTHYATTTVVYCDHLENLFDTTRRRMRVTAKRWTTSAKRRHALSRCIERRNARASTRVNGKRKAFATSSSTIMNKDNALSAQSGSTRD